MLPANPIKGMTMDFIAATEQGRNGFWRYALGTLTVLFFWLLLGSLPVLAAIVWAQVDGNPATMVDPATGLLLGVDVLWGGYLLPNLGFPFFLFGIFVAVRGIHGRALRTLVTPDPRIRWRRVGLGFGLWLVLAVVATGLEVALHPDAFVWQGVSAGRYAAFAILALIFTPLQTSTEELFFRGYLLQGMGRVVRRPWMLSIINGLLFAAPHFANPEVSQDPVLLMLYFFGMGAFFAWVTLRDGTAELVLGAHAANNLFVALLINYEGSALQTPALVMSTRLDPVFNLGAFLISAVVFAAVAQRGVREVGSRHHGGG
jgi:uncharacterized protein